jgi:hypothetical protein
MAAGKQVRPNSSFIRATGWVGAALAALAVLGLILIPSIKPLWIVSLLFAVSAVPQAFFLVRRDERRKRNRHPR